MSKASAEGVLLSISSSVYQYPGVVHQELVCVCVCVCVCAMMGEGSITWQNLLKKPPQAKEISPMSSILKKNSLLPDLLKYKCIHRVCGSV